MRNLSPKTVWLAAVVVASLAAVVWYYTAFLVPRGQKLMRLEQIEAERGRLEELMKEEFEVRRAEREIAATTLGKKQDVVEHRLRSGLTAIAERNGLGKVVVSQRQPLREESPLLRVKGVSRVLKSSLQKQPGFSVIEAQVNGVGKLEQVLRTFAEVCAQPWVHRVEAFTLRPEGKGAERFALRIDVTTIYVPELLEKEPGDPSPTAAGSREEMMVRQIAMRNAFAAPKPAPPPVAPVVPVAQAEPTPSPAPPPPRAAYEEWRVSGVVKSARGSEAFVLNVRTGERRVLAVGGAVLDAKFVEGGGERAVFEVGGTRCVVMVGQTLDARQPETQG